MGIKRGICRHCCLTKNIYARGLCNVCYQNPAITTQYPSTSRHGPKSGFRFSEDHRSYEEPDEPKPVRKPGEPPHRCLWCRKFRCFAMMQRCIECSAEYAERAATMPGKVNSDEF
jgi:hypothetical protein